jgi:hypothetical protein
MLLAAGMRHCMLAVMMMMMSAPLRALGAREATAASAPAALLLVPARGPGVLQ